MEENRESIFFNLFLNLLRASYLNIEKEWERVANISGLSYAQQECLWILSLEDGISLNKIGSVGQWNKSTTSALLSRLEDKGYVYKERGKNRIYSVYITEKGRDIIHDSMNEKEAIAFRSLLSDIPEKDLINYIELMYSLFLKVNKGENEDFSKLMSEYSKKITGE